MLKVTGERVEALTLVPFFAVYKGSLKTCMFFKAFLPCLFLPTREETGMVVLLILCTLMRGMSEANQNIFIEKGKEKD